MVNFKDGNLVAILLGFIGVIIAVTFLISIANQVNLETNTFEVINGTVVAPSAINGTTDLTGRELVTQIEVYNATNFTDPTNGVFLRTGTGTNGLRSVQLFVNETGEPYLGFNINVTYTYNPDGFLSDGVTRNIANLIPLFAALAALVFIIVIFISKGSMGELIRGTMKGLNR